MPCKQLQKQNYKYAKVYNEQWEAKEGKGRATYIDITGGLEDGWRLPLDETIVVEGGFRHRGDVVVAVGAGWCFGIIIIVGIILIIICGGVGVGISVPAVFFMCDENAQNDLRKGEIGRHMGEKSDDHW